MLIFSDSLKQNVTGILVSRDSQNESAMHLKIKNLEVKLRGVQGLGFGKHRPANANALKCKF